jgi:4-amino-4-deoxy-L-arabinose transferase-like glycosyltransferase
MTPPLHTAPPEAEQEAPGAVAEIRRDPESRDPESRDPEIEEPFYRRILPLLGVGSLLVSCVFWSARKQLAGDELFTWAEIRDPSFAHLLHAMSRLGGGGMPLFYLTAWPWAHVFGLSSISLRLYSSVAICAAFLVLLAALRRRFTARAAFLGVAFALFACFVVVDQNGEARGYGLYLLVAVLASVQCLRIAETPRPRPRDLVLLVLTQAGLVLGHVLGLLYAGLLLLALIAADAWERRLRPRVYLCCIAGWLALIPWIPAIRASMAVGKPHGWIPMPAIGDLATGFSFWLFAGIYFPVMQHHPAGLVAGWFCAVACVLFLVASAINALRTAAPARRPVYLLAFALMLAPLVFFVVSQLASPIYTPRYMIPSVIGVAILSVSWVERSRAGQENRTALLSLIVLLLPIASAALATPTSLNVARIDQLAAGRPVVCPWLRDFLTMERYSSQAASLEYPLDWPAALAGPPAAVGGFHLMQNYRREGYFAANLQDVSAVLSQPAFLVLDDTQTNWFHLAIENNPRFTWRLLAPIDTSHRLLEVTQESATSQ